MEADGKAVAYFARLGGATAAGAKYGEPGGPLYKTPELLVGAFRSFAATIIRFFYFAICLIENTSKRREEKRILFSSLLFSSPHLASEVTHQPDRGPYVWVVGPPRYGENHPFFAFQLMRCDPCEQELNAGITRVRPYPPLFRVLLLLSQLSLSRSLSSCIHQHPTHLSPCSLHPPPLPPIVPPQKVNYLIENYLELRAIDVYRAYLDPRLGHSRVHPWTAFEQAVHRITLVIYCMVKAREAAAA